MSAEVATEYGAAGLTGLLQVGGLRTLFQPIVSLDGGETVGYEALTRGPRGPWESPLELFAQARSEGLLQELDEACRSAALRAAHQLGLLDPALVFVNVEPEVLRHSTLDELAAVTASSPGDVRVVLEITERALAVDPAELLRSVDRVRDLGWGVALDDVGTSSSSLAFMGLLRPDVIKLDISLIQQPPTPASAKVMHAVNAHAERSGALVLAEGVENESHLLVARGLGASLGQGWLFGRPSSRPAPVPGPPPVSFPPPVRVLASAGLCSPFSCLPETTHLRRLPKRLLLELSRHLENEAADIGRTCVVATAFQSSEHFTPATAHRYRGLVERAGFVCVLGDGFDRDPLPGLRGASLAADDPIRDEWDVVVLSPHFSTALLARDLGDSGPDLDRRFEYALTYDRETVVRATQEMLSRVSRGRPDA